MDNRFFWAMQQGKQLGLLEQGDGIVGVQGWERGAGHTNTVRILLIN